MLLFPLIGSLVFGDLRRLQRKQIVAIVWSRAVGTLQFIFSHLLEKYIMKVEWVRNTNIVKVITRAVTQLQT